MKKVFILLLACGAVLSVAAQNKTTKPMKNAKTGFVHTVYFWLKDADSQTAKDSLYAGLQVLSSIGQIREAYIGVPAATRRPVIDHTYSYSVTFVFKNKANQDVYQEHPVHQKFIADCAHLWERVQVYDAVGR